MRSERAVVDEAARLEALRELAVVGTPPEQRFDRITRLAARLFGTPMAAVTLVDADEQFIKSGSGIEPGTTARRDAFCNVTIQEDGVLVVPDATDDDRFADNPYVVGDPNIVFYAGQPLQARGGQRVGALCVMDDVPHEWSDADTALLRDLALWVQKELVIEEELRRAAEVQRGLLPRNQPEVDGYDIAGACVPSSSVGGDLYDWQRLPKGLVLTVADVMGKGMGGAILMASARAVLRAVTPHAGLADAVDQAARALADDLDQTGSFVTMFHGLLHPASGDLTYVDAGHGLAFVARSTGAVERLQGDDLPLGIAADVRWTEHRLRLEEGDALAVFSDGVLDVVGEPMAREAIDDAVGKVAELVRGGATAADAIAALTAGPPAGDDVTAVVVRRVAP
jgi:serine phosphatase RsbU (regulator of sigma subunit)